MTRSVLRAVTLLACALVCALGFVACGDDGNDSPGAKGLLEQSFRTTASDVKSGRLTVDAKLDPEGLLALAGPITLKASGPFAVSPGSGPPSFDLDVDALVAGKRLPAGVLSDGKRAYLKLDGEHYVVDDDFPILDRLRSGKDALAIAALGIDPRKWITGAEEKGSEQVGGVETTHIVGGVDAARLLADLEKVIATQPAAQSGTPEQREQIAKAVKDASVEVWSGKDDKILRQLLLRVRFDFPPGADPPIPGLDKGTVEVRARIDDVNGQPPKISAPARFKPFSELPDTGVAGLVKCVSDAIKKSSSVARCAAKLLG